MNTQAEFSANKLHRAPFFQVLNYILLFFLTLSGQTDCSVHFLNLAPKLSDCTTPFLIHFHTDAAADTIIAAIPAQISRGQHLDLGTVPCF
jgi:hypothetical protein